MFKCIPVLAGVPLLLIALILSGVIIMSNNIVLPKDRVYIPVLSVRQPWASLIADGLKTIEVRKWVPGHRGPLAIHASQSFDNNSFHVLRHLHPDLVLKDEPLGEIIAVVNLDCIYSFNHESFLDTYDRHYNPIDWYQKGLKGWVFSDIKRVKPVPHRGSLGLSRVLTARLEVIE